MKKLILKSSIACLSLMGWGAVHAQQSARVEFAGQISSTTCVVSANSQNQLIFYGPVPPDNTGFTNGGGSVGNVARAAFARDVVINLDGCSAVAGAPVGSVNVRVTSPTLNTAGRLGTGNSTVDIELLHHDSTDSWNMNTESRNVPLVVGSNTLRFNSRYYVAAVPLTPGTANALATFNMQYP